MLISATMAAPAPPTAPPLPRRRCAECPAVQLQPHAAPGGSSRTARCSEAGLGRLIAWHHQAADLAPHWCPREARA